MAKASANISGAPVRKRVKKDSFEDDPSVEQADKVRSQKILMIAARRGRMLGPADKIANEHMHHSNWYYEGAARLFPDDPEMRLVNRYYPYAEGGPLLIDVPTTKWGIKRCKEKAEVLNKAKIRYCYIDYALTSSDGLSREEKQIENAMEQMGVLE